MSSVPNWLKTNARTLLAALLLGVASLLTGTGVLQLGYNLAAPLLRAPSMTFGEALGFTLLGGLVVTVIALLKERA